MKYIRTKNRILLNPAPHNCGNNEFGVYAGEEARQADTIDDLLDGYICHGELVRDILVAKSYSKTYNLPIYGCIYVEGEGFIVVAKVVDILPDGEVSWSLRVD